MPKTAINEVDVLRFFETESVDKVTVLFNIVSDKMRARLNEDHAQPSSTPPERRRSKTAKGSGAAPEQTPLVE
jgi:hypothetical protein